MKRVKRAAKIAVLLSAAYIVALGIYREFFPEKIRNNDDLIRIVREENSKLMLKGESKHIYWMYGATPWGTAASYKLSNGNYVVILDGWRDRTSVRHELYHIYAGHCDKAFQAGSWTTSSKVKNEFTARLYADYGLRL